MRALLIAGFTATVLSVSGAVSGPAMAAGDKAALPHVNWSFKGLFGTFDRGALQRGFQVYKEVCAGCHALNYMYYRNLQEIGFTEEQVKKIAAEVDVEDGPNDEGEMFERPGRPGDKFLAPFPNEKAARAANGGAFPPNLSVMTKARPNGVNYSYGLLIGYKEAPGDFKLAEGMSYNTVFAGHQIAMPPPLSEGAVEYADGTKATVDQMAKDVTTFMAWAAEPELERRKGMGIKVILFLLVLTGLLYAYKRKVWADVH